MLPLLGAFGLTAWINRKVEDTRGPGALTPLSPRTTASGLSSPVWSTSSRDYGRSPNIPDQPGLFTRLWERAKGAGTALTSAGGIVQLLAVGAVLLGAAMLVKQVREAFR